MKPVLDRTFSTAALVLGGAALIFATTLARALTVQPAATSESIPAATDAAGAAAAQDAATTPDPGETMSPEGHTPGATSDVELPRPRVPSQRPLQTDEIRLAVDNDPFRPDRARPAPYRMPGEMDEEAPVRRELPPPPEFRVLGIIDQEPGGLALMQIEDATPRVLGVGETWMGYRLEKVAGTIATMVSADRTLDLALAPPSPQGPQRAARGGRGGRNTNAGNRGNNAGARGAAAGQAADRLRAMVEQLRSQGAPMEIIERLMGQLEERAIEMPQIRVDVRRNNPDTLDARAPQPRDR